MFYLFKHLGGWSNVFILGCLQNVMVISMLYDNVVLTLFIIVLTLIVLVLALIVIDFRKKKVIDRMVSPRYLVSKSGRKGKLPMSEDDLNDFKKDLLKREKGLRKMVLSERKEIERQRNVSAKMLKRAKLEVVKQKWLSKSIRVGLASVEAQKKKAHRELKAEMARLEKRRVNQSEQMCRNISRAWHEQVDFVPRDGKEWLRELRKKKRG